MFLQETNDILTQVLQESGVVIPGINEKFMRETDPSVVLSDYLEVLETQTENLRKLYYHNASNRNLAVEDAVEIMMTVERETTLAREKLKIGEPEDVNEDTDDKIDTIKSGSVHVGSHKQSLRGLSIKRRDNDVLLKKDKIVETLRSDAYPPLFFIDGTVYSLKGMELGYMRLSPVGRQSTGLSIIRDLESPEREEIGIKRLQDFL